ncbi:MAG: ABC transporter ATP-binding protein [Caldilineaceae bacterium]|nr:ABC transporter ATP-binding protein [Caldilineaceae bacterium]
MDEPNGPYAVELRDLTKTFLGRGGGQLVTAVDHVSLQIGQGEFFTLLGPSGCGKTTTLRMIAGFELPTAGDLLIQGRAMTNIPPNGRPVNTVFQNYALFPHMTVADNVAFGLRVKRVSKAEREQRVQEALALVQLSDLRQRRPAQLSGGQQQRVALARAIVNQPQVLLLDEPLGALDLKLRREMQLELKHLQAHLGITFIYVTHDQEEALTMSDRIAVMFDGVIAQMATPEELYRRPHTGRVASFIGVMNFLDARVKGQADGRITLDVQALGPLQVPETALPDGMSAADIHRVGVRPEMMTVLLDAGDKAAHTIDATVADTAYYGDMTYYSVALPGKDEPVTISMRNTAGRAVLKPGSPARVGFSPDSIVVFR